MDSVEISRFLTGMTLAVHIIFATIGVGMPLMFAIAEFLESKQGSQIYSISQALVERLYHYCCCRCCNRYNYRFTIIINLANIYENGWACHCFTTIYGDICVLL